MVGAALSEAGRRGEIDAVDPRSNGNGVKLPPPWLTGAALFPFGLVIGFTITTLPFLLTREGVALPRIASTSAVVMSPTFWGFLLSPLLDSGLTRRTYGWLMALIAAMSSATALWIFTPGRLGAATALLALAELAIVLYANAIWGWTAEFTPDNRRGSVGGWTNVANLGGGALGALVLMSLATVMPTRWLGLVLGGMVLLGVAPTLAFPPARSSAFRLQQMFSDALRTTWKTCHRTDCLLGFTLFLAPAGAAAAINLFSGLGQDFHVSERTVILVTGGGCALSASIGSLLGGYAANRVARAYLFLCGATGVALCALALAVMPSSAESFVVGALIYNLLTGIVFAAFTALGFQLVGQMSEVASTQIGLFAAAINAAIVYMTWADGVGYKHYGVRGLFLVDGLASLISIGPLLWLLRRYSPSRPVGRRV